MLPSHQMQQQLWQTPLENLYCVLGFYSLIIYIYHLSGGSHDLFRWPLAAEISKLRKLHSEAHVAALSSWCIDVLHKYLWTCFLLKWSALADREYISVFLFG